MTKSCPNSWRGEADNWRLPTGLEPAIVIIASSPFPGLKAGTWGRDCRWTSRSAPLWAAPLCYAADRRPAVSIPQKKRRGISERLKALSVSDWIGRRHNAVCAATRVAAPASGLDSETDGQPNRAGDL
jgi:hypothetical protein